jgi:pyruvate,water dikinase
MGGAGSSENEESVSDQRPAMMLPTILRENRTTATGPMNVTVTRSHEARRFGTFFIDVRDYTSTMAVLWLDEVGKDDIDAVGGKGASLGELAGAGLPVPPAFVVTAGTYRSFIEETGIDEALFDAVDVDPDDSSALAAATAEAEDLILGTEMPDELREEILETYGNLDDGEAFVAVRSSATAEDLPDASFAGQQETFLNVTGDDLVQRVKECWASLFTQRAIYYREQQGFDHRNVDIAVVVQRMVDAEKSGVMFTSHPSTGAPELIVEAAWGLGEAVVAGEVSPDNYVVDRDSHDLDSVTVADKKTMCVKDPETGETTMVDVPDGKREAQVLDEDELDSLIEIGEQVEDHYGDPQDVEWAIVDGEVYMLQSRPITTIADDGGEQTSVANGGDESGTSDDVLLTGLGASPGIASGAVAIVGKLDQLDKVSEGDVIVTEMTTPDMVPAMKRASGIVTDEGGMTSHAAIVSRELGVPAVVGSQSATSTLSDGRQITIDGDKGTIREGEADDGERDAVEEVRPQSPVKPMTATEVKVNVSIPEAAERAAATGADGVGLLRMEHMILSTNKTPEKYIDDHGEDAYIEEIVEGVRNVAEEFYPRPVRVRTLDAPTDEFRQLEGGESEPDEHNPMLGYRGIRRSLDRPDVFVHELEAFRQLYGMGYDNVEVMLPLVNDVEDVLQAKNLMQDAGIDPDKRSWGVMVETPASALRIEEMADAGIDFASFGTNDLTQYTLAVDRNNGQVADRFDELHPAVLELIGRTIETCRENDVATSICGQAGSKPQMVQFLVNEGISSISANIDAVRDVQHEVKRVEQKLVLDTVR